MSFEFFRRLGMIPHFRETALTDQKRIHILEPKFGFVSYFNKVRWWMTS
ncbi:hypothetical protein C7820_5495 [Paenibacillus sp. VMFN-D1]|nr:hypothetical protein C7820_5495 [Paenibacillus sp. VMFN-D1]